MGGGRGQLEAELLPLVLLSVLLGSVEPLPTLVGKQECASHLHARQKLFLCGYPHFCGAFHCWLKKFFLMIKKKLLVAIVHI